MTTVAEAKELICELCRGLYNQGHASGTGGGISIKVGDQIVMAPSGVQKERMQPEDMFVLDKAGNVLEAPSEKPPPYKPPKLSECAPLFMAVSNYSRLPPRHAHHSCSRGVELRLQAHLTLRCCQLLGLRAAGCRRCGPRSLDERRAGDPPRPRGLGVQDHPNRDDQGLQAHTCTNQLSCHQIVLSCSTCSPCTRSVLPQYCCPPLGPPQLPASPGEPLL